MDPRNLQKLTETVNEIGVEMKESIENSFGDIGNVEDEKQRSYLQDIHRRTKEAVENKDSKAANDLIIELKDFMKNGI